MSAFAVTADCVGCGGCLRTCPERVIRPAAPGSAVPLVVGDGCSACGECAEVCPVDACVELGRRR
ncbi:MAG TPA: 4Fe-4S dicluster domain-containing protein [Egibacteraceae bacterium]|nr:4Fe-4S dicluster domain-containing protein [Egibacteraceae bacterium]